MNATTQCTITGIRPIVYYLSGVNMSVQLFAYSNLCIRRHGNKSRKELHKLKSYHPWRALTIISLNEMFLIFLNEEKLLKKNEERTYEKYSKVTKY